jgi:hypothetical protein
MNHGSMRLHQADCHLAYARLHLACGEKEAARESLAKTKRMIEEMGYHRRDGEVAELEKALQVCTGGVTPPLREGGEVAEREQAPREEA